MTSPGFAEVSKVTLIQLLNWPLTAIKLINSLLIATCKSPKIDIYVLPIFPILVGTIRILEHGKMVSLNERLCLSKWCFVVMKFSVADPPLTKHSKPHNNLSQKGPVV